MQYFGVPICPYCKKRVNLIRTWSLKKEGEYRCPRCQGISNIYLSPLVYVFALLAVFSGLAIYFFHKFILNDVSPSIIIQIIIPFVLFFLISLFLVYLEKPVIKKAPLEEERRGTGKERAVRREESRSRQEAFRSGQVYLDNKDYLSPDDSATGPVRLPEKQSRPLPSQNSPRDNFQTSVVDLPTSRSVPAALPLKKVPAVSSPVSPERERRAVRSQTGTMPRRTDSPPSSSQDDYFAKYNDPAYVNSRLEQKKREQGQDER